MWIAHDDGNLECLTVQRFKTRARPPDPPSPRPSAHANQDSYKRCRTENHAQLGAVPCGPPQCAELLVSFLTHVLLTSRERPAGVVRIADLPTTIGRRYGDYRSLTTFEKSVTNNRLSVEDIWSMHIQPDIIEKKNECLAMPDVLLDCSPVRSDDRHYVLIRAQYSYHQQSMCSLTHQKQSGRHRQER